MGNIIDFFINLNPIWQALIATTFTWFVTALGASLVFFFKKVNKTVLDAMLGFAAGVMIAASFWSLLEPATEMAEILGMIPWLVIFAGFIGGGLLLYIGDKLYNLYEKNKKQNPKEEKSFKRSMMLMFSITFHNIPEGMAIGVAFGAVAYGLEGATLAAACLLALGIGIQNFPEGTAVSVPLRRDGMSRKKAFFYGQLSGIVEPIAGFIGAILVLSSKTLLPYLLAAGAGAMIYVVIQELIPESQSNKRKALMTLVTLVGFSIMMILDVALG